MTDGRTERTRMLFDLGKLVITPGALDMLHACDAGVNLAAHLIRRHVIGDWGDLDAHDAQANLDAVRDGNRILSSYILDGDGKIWIITEADRSVTTLLLPEEY